MSPSQSSAGYVMTDASSKESLLSTRHDLALALVVGNNQSIEELRGGTTLLTSEMNPSNTLVEED